MSDENDSGERGEHGEPLPANQDPENIEAVERKLTEIRRRKHTRVRWGVSRHTAEMAIEALAGLACERKPVKNGKARRRKKAKRLL